MFCFTFSFIKENFPVSKMYYFKTDYSIGIIMRELNNSIAKNANSRISLFLISCIFMISFV